MASRKQLRIVFLHPDLGIGGAERLVVDAAVGLQNRGHKVTILTSHCDKSRSFPEVLNDEIDVRVRGNKLVPTSINGRFKILCAIGRQLHLVLQTCLMTPEMIEELRPDVIFVDQLSAAISVLRFFLSVAALTGGRKAGGTSVGMTMPRIMFYCHFPDKLLAKHESTVEKMYRLPFDQLESFSTGLSDVIVVNSRFTKAVFASAFPRLVQQGWNPEVVYPCVNLDFDSLSNPSSSTRVESPVMGYINARAPLVVSLNRFERKKAIERVLLAFANLPAQARPKKNSKSKPPPEPVLVIAGGYDDRISENVEYHESLVKLCTRLGLNTVSHFQTGKVESTTATKSRSTASPVLFLLSVSSEIKTQLLHHAALLVYTPSDEHFGIVPLEAMAAGLPVLADASGGPLETIVDLDRDPENATGWLRKADDAKNDDWNAVLQFALDPNNKAQLTAMGQRGKERAKQFSQDKMAARIEHIMLTMISSPQRTPSLAGSGISPLAATVIMSILVLFISILLNRVLFS